MADSGVGGLWRDDNESVRYKQRSEHGRQAARPGTLIAVLNYVQIMHNFFDSMVFRRLALRTMKLITTIVRPERLPEVKAALFQAGITGITLSRVSGHGGEQEIVSQYRGTTVVMEFHEKVKIEMVCSEPFVEPCINAILSSARTGEVGDGKIFVQPIERVIRIRTGESDNAALTAVNADAVQRAALETAHHEGGA